MVADKNLTRNLHMQVFSKRANQRIMIMTKPLILVTGATGKTGRPVVEQLLVHGYPVRTFVHRVDERSRHLSALGAEVVVTDIVETITGRPPQSLAEFIRTHGSEFSRERASARAA